MLNNLVIMLRGAHNLPTYQTADAYSLLIYQTAYVLNLLMTKLHFVVYNYVTLLGESTSHLQMGGCHDDIQCPTV